MQVNYSFRTSGCLYSQAKDTFLTRVVSLERLGRLISSRFFVSLAGAPHLALHGSGGATPPVVRPQRITMWSAGVEPLGNLLYEEGGMMAGMRARAKALGVLRVLPDALICKITPHLNANDLISFAQTSSFCRAFAIDEDIWRRVTLSKFGIDALAKYGISWRATYAALVREKLASNTISNSNNNNPNNPEESEPQTQRNQVKRFKPSQSNPPTLRKVYSDILFHKWRCLFARVQDGWHNHDNAIRCDAATTNRQSFRIQFESRSTPVVITHATDRWPARRSWDLRTLLENHGNTRFDVGGFDLRLRDYLFYCLRVTASDDQALLLFDPKFAEKAPAILADYQTPHYFQEDLFDLLPPDFRPDYQWLIVGPARSGSTFHQDPNSTSAWNACIVGKKKWMLFPPNAPPPGVSVTSDGGKVQAPVSVIEWFVNYYEQAHEYGRKVGAIECVVNAGEVMFIPAGWFHIVLNLELTVAVTQNYASPVNIAAISSWLQRHPQDISGVKTKEQKMFISQNFANLVAIHRPELVPQMLQSGAIRLEDLPENIRRHAIAKIAELERQQQLQRQMQQVQPYRTATQNKHMCNEDEEYSDSEDIHVNTDGTVAEIIQYDGGRGNGATDSSSAEDVVLPPLQTTIRSSREDSTPEVDEVILTPRNSDNNSEKGDNVGTSGIPAENHVIHRPEAVRVGPGKPLPLYLPKESAEEGPAKKRQRVSIELETTNSVDTNRGRDTQGQEKSEDTNGTGNSVPVAMPAPAPRQGLWTSLKTSHGGKKEDDDKTIGKKNNTSFAFNFEQSQVEDSKDDDSKNNNGNNA